MLLPLLDAKDASLEGILNSFSDFASLVLDSETQGGE
jgi:hypothetical protein